MLTRRGVLLAKSETTYGVDPVPTVTANALLIKDLDVKITGETVERDFLRQTLSPLEFLRGIKQAEVTFTSELKGTGTVGVLPAWGWEGVLFKACAMGETVTADDSIVYAPVSSDFGSCTLYVYKDGLFHAITGCRGTFKINLEVGKLPSVDWTFQGLYSDVVDSSPAALTYSSIKPPIALAAAFSIGGYSPALEKIELDISNTVARRKSINSTDGIVECMITSRSPQGSFDPEAVLEASHAFWGNWKAATALALSIGPIGSTAGNKISIAAPKVQYKDPTYGDRDGILTYSIPFAMAGDAGDDELTIIFE